MRIEINKMILNEYRVVEEMVQTCIIPPYYSNINILVNRLYRYFYEIYANNAVDLLRQMLDKLNVTYDEQTLEETVGKYTIVQPLKRTNGINVYQEEVDAINRIKGRSNQRTAFGLLVIQKVLSPHSNKLYLDYYDDIFKVVNISNQTERNKTCHELYQQGVIDVPLFDNYIELLISRTDGKINTTIKDNFDKIDEWFDKIFAENTNLETVIMVDEDGVREFTHTGYRGTANILQQEGINIKGTDIKKICELQREQLNGVFFFTLDDKLLKREGDYELRKEAYIEAMTKARHILIKCKRNPNKRKKLYIRVNSTDGTSFTVRIK